MTDNSQETTQNKKKIFSSNATISNLYSDYIKNPYNSIISQINNKEIKKAYENKHLFKEGTY